MRLRKTILGILLYLVPAMSVLVAYSAYHELLFKRPACRGNCETTATQPRDIRKTLDLIDELARHKADLLKRGQEIYGFNIGFLQDRLEAMSLDVALANRYGSGQQHQRWARLNAQFHAKISDYLNQALMQDYFGDALLALSDIAKTSRPNVQGRTNLAESVFSDQSSLIGQAIARDFLPGNTGYLVSPANLGAGGVGGGTNSPSLPNNPTFPGGPVSVIPVPNAVYMMLSAVVLFGWFQRKKLHCA